MNLLIVESPAKAKTIEKYLGKDFVVKSSYGHIRDLTKNKDGVDVDNNFEPKYIVSKEKTKVVKELKTWVKKANEVWLATDEDREGEAISWHLCEVLNLDVKETKRIVFREITKTALQKAIQSPRKVDLNLVNAQQARRILDRLVGFELSGLLWRKVKGKLSAGRVQSVAVKLLVERERLIQNFKPVPFFKVSALYKVKNKQNRWVDLKADLRKPFDKEEDAAAFLEKCKAAVYKIQNIKTRPLKRKPAAPFTTSTLQQEASRKLGFSVSRTMSTAQRLYESGHITYMRTDSTSLSEQALASIASEIENLYGKQYVQTRRFKTKKQNAQEAHEAIRPTFVQNTGMGQDRDQQRLYDLIWKRTVASQMAEAIIQKTTVDIGISSVSSAVLKAEGEVIQFDGFLKVYLESKEEEEENEAKGMLPPLKVGQQLDLKQMTATERFSKPPARFTEASLVKKLEELGIGRPSTYAPTISRITNPTRGYVVKESREGKQRLYTLYTLANGAVTKTAEKETYDTQKNKLFPSDMGMIVVDFLDQHFSNIMQYNFTADIEGEFDNIAAGNQIWVDMLKEFYHPFHKEVQETLEKADRATGERILGKDPETGRTVLVRMSRYGSVAQIGTTEELGEEKPKYANLKPTQSIETITLEDALPLFQFPKHLGSYDDKDVVIGEGRFGPYVKFEDKFISIPKGESPHGVDLGRAIELIEERRKADAPVGYYNEKPITKGSGRFGPFIKWDGMFINIPRRIDPETISQLEMDELIEKKIEKEANRYIHKWDDLKLTVENGRWGPFIRFKKHKIQLKNEEGKRLTSDDAKEMSLEDVKKLVIAVEPKAFEPKKKKTTRKRSTKKKK